MKVHPKHGGDRIMDHEPSGRSPRLTVSLPDETHTWLDEERARTGESKSSLVREGLRLLREARSGQ